LIVSSGRYPYSLAEFLSEEEVRETVLGTEYSAAKIVSAIYDRIAKKTGKKVARASGSIGRRAPTNVRRWQNKSYCGGYVDQTARAE
jgi:hypothetical protein